MKERLCHWHCGRTTGNISGICDKCWQDRDALFAARKAREAQAEVSPAKKEALIKATAAAMAKRHVQINGTDT